jgi:hypothetical protein
MIDINTLIENAIKQATDKIVAEAMEGLTMRMEGIRCNFANRLNDLDARCNMQIDRHGELWNRVNKLEAHTGVATNADVKDLNRRIDELETTTRDMLKAHHVRMGDLEGGMRSLRTMVEGALEEKADYASHAHVSDEVERLRRRIDTLDHATAQNDEAFKDDVKSALADLLNEENLVANAVADAFENGALTISVDKV